MKAIIALVLLLLCSSAWADGMPTPEGPRFALMNGSVVQIVSGPNGQVTITYVQPRPGLWGLVLPGAVLAQGLWHDDHFEATVYGTNIPCRMQVPYPVSGSINPDGVLTLVGQSPLIDSYTCQVIGTEWSPASSLAFIPMPQQPQPIVETGQ